MKKALSLVLSLILCVSCFSVGSFAADFRWDEEQVAYGVTMFPGEDESERYIAWYSESAEGRVVLSGDEGEKTVEATAKKTAQGDYRLGAILTDLEDGEYTYYCAGDGYETEHYDFTVDSDEDFTALYLTDIHVSHDKYETDSLELTAGKFDSILEAAADKAELDLIISAGDQASNGLRTEYEAFTAPELVKQIPIATTVGNHDRKSVDYKYFTFTPNEGELKYKSYVGTDWYFTRGNVLFLMLDSCNSSMKDHYKFIKNATETVEGEKWIIATFHHDLFGGREPSRESENKLLRLLWTGIFDEFGVDLCLYGHSHYYTLSNVIYNNTTAESLVDKTAVTDPKGTVYMASASVNNPEEISGDEPLGEHIAHSYLTEESIYTILDFEDDELKIESYTLDSDELIDTLSVTKTTNEGGHEYKNTKLILRPLIFFVSRIVNIINNFGPYEEYTEQGYEIPFFEAIIGS